MEYGVALILRLSDGNLDLVHTCTIPRLAALVKPRCDSNQSLSSSHCGARRGIIWLSVIVTLSQ